MITPKFIALLRLRREWRSDPIQEIESAYNRATGIAKQLENLDRIYTASMIFEERWLYGDRGIWDFRNMPITSILLNDKRNLTDEDLQKIKTLPCLMDYICKLHESTASFDGPYIWARNSKEPAASSEHGVMIIPGTERNLQYCINSIKKIKIK